MKVIELLREDSNKQTISDAVDLIVRDCKPYLSEIGDVRQVLYHGQKNVNAGKFISKQKIRKDREPLSMKPEIHKIIDDYFLKTFGVRFRSNAVFASTLKDTSFFYGQPFLIYPRGNFKYLWSTLVIDLYAFIDKAAWSKIHFMKQDESHRLTDLLDVKDLGKYTTTDIFRKVEDLGLNKLFSDEEILKIARVDTYKDSGLKDLVGQGFQREVMIGGDDYYLINAALWLHEMDKFLDVLEEKYEAN